MLSFEVKSSTFIKIYFAFYCLIITAIYPQQTQADTDKENGSTLYEVLAAVSPEFVTPIREAIAPLSTQGKQIRFYPLLGGGTASKIFRVVSSDRQYVLRLLDEKRPASARKAEIQAHKNGASLQIAPELFFADKDHLVMLMDFIPGKTLRREDFGDAALVNKVMAALKKYHHHPYEDSLAALPKVSAISSLYDRYRELKGVVFPSCYAQLWNMLQQDSVSLKTNHRPSHGDFNPRNIIVADDGRVYLIDWAQASVDHPFQDIGWLAAMLAANHEQVYNLLKGYLEREPTSSEMQEVIFFKNITTFLIATLWIGRQEERDQKVLDKMLASDLKKASAYILEGVAVTDVLLWRSHKLTQYALGWLKEYIDNQNWISTTALRGINPAYK